MRFSLSLILLFLSSFSIDLKAQTEAFGYVKDASTGEVLPFVNVYFSGTQSGNTTDIKGFFEIKTTAKSDTIIASYIGYKPQKVRIKSGQVNELSIELEPDIIALNEVIVRPGENPAWKVMRKVVANKEKYEPKNLEASEVESYTKIEGYIDKMKEGSKDDTCILFRKPF
jgi:hypothetical protein